MGADVISQGVPPTSNPNAPGSLIVDVVDGALYLVPNSGTPKALSSLIASLVNQTALTAITTAQTLFSVALGAGALNMVGRVLRVHGYVVFNTTAANVATVTLVLKLGGVTLGTILTTATNTAALTGAPLEFDFLIAVTTAGSSGAVVVSGGVNVQLGATIGAALTPFALPAADVTGINLTTADALAMTIAASAAIPSAKLQLLTVELVS